MLNKEIREEQFKPLVNAMDEQQNRLIKKLEEGQIVLKDNLSKALTIKEDKKEDKKENKVYYQYGDYNKVLADKGSGGKSSRTSFLKNIVMNHSNWKGHIDRNSIRRDGQKMFDSIPDKEAKHIFLNMYNLNYKDEGLAVNYHTLHKDWSPTSQSPISTEEYGKIINHWKVRSMKNRER